MHLRWRNGFIDAGRLWFCDGYGIELCWGRRDLMGETVREGEVLFADSIVFVVASGYDVKRYGSVWRAVLVWLLRLDRLIWIDSGDGGGLLVRRQH